MPSGRAQRRWRGARPVEGSGSSFHHDGLVGRGEAQLRDEGTDGSKARAHQRHDCAVGTWHVCGGGSVVYVMGSGKGGEHAVFGGRALVTDPGRRRGKGAKPEGERGGGVVGGGSIDGDEIYIGAEVVFQEEDILEALDAGTEVEIVEVQYVVRIDGVDVLAEGTGDALAALAE